MPVEEVRLENGRVGWIDTLKCFGIFAIYLAHFIDGAGFAYKFVCMYVIQLFFFTSGFFALKNIGRESHIRFIWKQVRHLILPYIVFSVINLSVIVINENRDINGILPMLKQAALGIRNQLYAPALWFIPCLFIVSILFYIVSVIFKKPKLVLLICLGIYVLAANFMPFDATETPRWIFNVDSALYYLLYYCLGAVYYPFIKDFTWEKLRASDCHKNLKTVIVVLVGIIALTTTILTFFGRKDYYYIYPLFARFKLLTWMYPVFIALCIIAVNIYFAKSLQHIGAFKEMGKNTLLLCCNEMLVKTLVPCLLSVAGLSLQLSSPLAAYLYAGLLLVLCSYVIIPLEKKILKPEMLGSGIKNVR